MKYSKILYLLVVSFTLFCLQTNAQSGNSGLEKDPNYSALIKEEKTLKTSQDSITNIITQKRDLFKSDEANKTKHAQDIEKLELTLFDIRSKLSSIATKLNSIEQEYIMKNFNNTDKNTDSQSDIQHKYLLANKFIKDNISKEEMSMLKNSPKLEAQITEIGKRYISLYDKQKKTATDYVNATDKNSADSILNTWTLLIKDKQALDNEITNIWKPVYTLKYDIFRRLLDKMSAPTSVTEQLDDKSRTTRSNETGAKDTYNSGAFYIYPQERRLILEYEKALSAILKTESTKDSIDKVIKSINIEEYALPQINITKQNFVNFAPITIAGDSVHSEKNPIPKLHIPSKGTMYKIEIGTYTKQPVSYTTFRKIYPIEYDVLDDGKFRYYAGTYNNKEAAQSDYDRLRKLGMKVSVVEWKDGYQLDAEGKPIIRVKTSDAYRIIFPTITDKIKAVMDIDAANKEMSKINFEGRDVYSIGLFDNKEEAEEIANKMGSDAKVIGVDL